MQRYIVIAAVLVALLVAFFLWGRTPGEIEEPAGDDGAETGQSGVGRLPEVAGLER